MKIVKIANGGLEHILSEGAREPSDGFIIRVNPSCEVYIFTLIGKE